MAVSNLQIQIQAVVEGLSNINSLWQSLKNLGSQAVTSGEQAKGAGAGIAGIGSGSKEAAGKIAEFLEQSTQASNALNKLNGLVRIATQAFMAYAAVASLKDSADIAARNETLGVTLGIVGQNAGYSKDELSKYETELKKMGITTGAARDSMIQMMQAGLSLGPVTEGATAQITQLARAAQDLAVVTGENSSETLRRMITNIQQLDTVGLRFMGIVVNMDEATEKYATSINKAASALTQQERQQAFMNATLEKAKAMTGAYEASMDTVGKKVASLSRYQQEAAASIGEMLLPAYGKVVDAATNFLIKLKEISDAMVQNGTVAEMLKSAVSGLLEYYGKVASAVVEAVQSIAPHVMTAVNKIRAAFADMGTEGVIEAIKEIISWIADMGSFIVEVVGNSAPYIRLLVDAFVLVGKSIYGVVRDVMGLASGMKSTEGAATALSVALSTVGFLLAAFADGLQVVKAVAEIMFAALAVGFGAIAHVIGRLVGLVSADLGTAFKKVGDLAIEMGVKSADAAAKTMQSFANGETYVASYLRKLEELPAAHEKESEAVKKSADDKKEAFSKAEEMVAKYVRAVNEGKLRGEEAANAYQKLVTTLNEMKEEFGFTEAQANKLNEQLKRSKEAATSLDKDFKDLKVNVTEFATGMSQAGSTAIAAFDNIVKAGKYTSSQLYQLFSKALDMETSIRGLERYKDSLEKLFKEGKISVEQYQSAIQLLGAKFDELFSKKLKAATTKEDFKQLREEVEELGRKGTITGQQVALAMEQIREKATASREEIKRLAAQQTALAEATTKAVQADLEVSRAVIKVQQEKNALLKAEKKHKEENTELSKAELEAARLNVKLAEEKARLAALQRDQEKAAMDVLIAQQKLLNAEKEAGLKIGDAEAQAKVLAAQKEVDSKQLVLENTNQAVESQKQHVMQVEASAEKAKQLADNLKEAAENAQEASQSVIHMDRTVRDASGNILQVATFTFDNVVKELQSIGMSLEDASQKADDLMNGMQSVVAMGWGGVAAYDAIRKGIAQARDEMARNAEIASKVESEFQKVAASAEDVARGVEDSGKNMLGWGVGADQVAEAFKRIRKSAREAGEAAVDSARGFIASTRSIREELLGVQGRDEEAARMRYDQRKKDLALEYQILEVKIKAAIIQAKAAGVDTNDLEKSLSDSRRAFEQAKADLAELERLEIAKIRKAKEEQKKADEEAKRRVQEDLRAVESSSNAKEITTLTPERILDSVPRTTPLSRDEAQRSGTSVTSTPEPQLQPKMTLVKFELGRDSVAVRVPEDEETKLIEILKKARGVA